MLSVNPIVAKEVIYSIEIELKQLMSFKRRQLKMQQLVSALKSSAQRYRWSIYFTICDWLALHVRWYKND